MVKQSQMVNLYLGLDLAPRLSSTKWLNIDFVEIYTLGSGGWRRIEHVPPARHRSLFGTFVNGALHWLAKLPNGSVLIRYFDLENEQFRANPLPSSRVYYASFKRLNLGIFGDCLSLSSIGMYASDWDIEIWVTKEYGVKRVLDQTACD